MPVYDQSYQHWGGRFRDRRLRWLPMVAYHVRLMMKRKLVWLLLFMAFVPAIVFSFIIYVSSQTVEEGVGGVGDVVTAMTREIRALERGDPIRGHWGMQRPEETPMDADDQYWLVVRYGYYFYFLYLQCYIVLMTASIVGAGLIANDVRSNALEIYLTKPITALDYLMGKLAVIGFFVFLVLLVPALLMFMVASAVWTGFATAAWPILGPLLLICLLLSFVNGMVILGLSSLAKSPRYATIIWFVLCFLTLLVGTILLGTTRNTWLEMVSYRENFAIIIGHLLDTKPLYELMMGRQIGENLVRPPLWLPVVILSGYVLMSARVMRRTLRTMENR